MFYLYLLTYLLVCLTAVYLHDNDDQLPKTSVSMVPDTLEFEPVNPIKTGEETTPKDLKNIECDDFGIYAANCTMEAAFMYNSSRKVPPMPAKMTDWCQAIRHLASCAIDWNTDCKDITDSYFNEESIHGHMYVIENICEDDWFLSKYDELPTCIDGAAESWERCYATFKNTVDEQKNTTHEWTHYETHFLMCCARAQFRRCTLNTFFDIPDKCPYEQVVTLQKFSVIVSEGDVFQDCDRNVMYENCPGGDPRPSMETLTKLLNGNQMSGCYLQTESKFLMFVLIFVVINF